MGNLAESKHPREQNTEVRRTRILDAALSLFAEKGFGPTTTKDLADRADVAQGLIYHYFGTKEKLLVAVVEERGFLQELREAVSVSFDRPAREGMKHISSEMFRIFGEKQHVCQIFWSEARKNDYIGEQWVAMIRETIDVVARYLAARVAEGELRPHDTEVSASMLLQPTVMQRMIGAGPEGLNNIVEYLLAGIEQKIT